MRPRVARDVRGFFPLLDERLGLGTEGYSLALLAKIEYAGANEESFLKAAEVLRRLAELSISEKHVERITERMGHERADERDAQVKQMKAGKLSPAHAQPPRVAAIHLDAGKIQMRAEDGKPGVREPHWSDTKVACMLTYSAPAGNVDPQPKPPKAFLDPPDGGEDTPPTGGRDRCAEAGSSGPHRGGHDAGGRGVRMDGGVGGDAARILRSAP